MAGVPLVGKCVFEFGNLDCSVIRCDAFASHTSCRFVQDMCDVEVVMVLDGHAYEGVAG